MSFEESAMIYAASGKTTEARNVERETKAKCEYANKVFPILPNTCSAPPILNFKNIYSEDRVVSLWNFQQKNCIFRVSEVFLLLFAFSILIIFLNLVLGFQ